MPSFVIILLIVLIPVAIFLIMAIIYKNAFVVLSNQVEEAFATMDVYLKRRWDLIPNLVETVKGYTKHEKDTFADVVKLRNGYGTLSTNEKIAANVEL